MDQETTTRPANNKRLLGAVFLSLLPLGALVYWGLSALDEDTRTNPRGKQSTRIKAPAKAKKPLRVSLALKPALPPLPEKTSFSTQGTFFLSDVPEPRFVTESFWIFKARSSHKPVTIIAQGRKEVFKDGAIAFRFKKLEEGKQSHLIIARDTKKREVRGEVSFIVDTKAPSIVLFDLTSGFLSIKLGDSIQGRVQDAYLKSLTINGEAWSYDSKGLFTYTPGQVGEQILILRATDAAGQSRELKCVVKVSEPAEAAPIENNESIDVFNSPSSSYSRGKKWKYYGAATCVGASCHDTKKPQENRPGDEYLTWSQKDRHAKAYNILFTEAATEIAEELNIEEASKNSRCLSCHTNSVPKDLQGDKYNIEDGISCDACHGPAEGWFKVHTKPHRYKDMLQLGMWDTRNVYRRADVCIKCHSQIDSELVDAGHPMLDMELFSATQRQPPHYYERNTWDPVRLWSVGLLVGAREDARALVKDIKKQKDQDTLLFRSAILETKLKLARHLPSRLKHIRSAPFLKYYRKQPNYEKLGAKDIKTLESWAVSFDKYARTLSETGPRSVFFARTRLKILGETYLKEAAKSRVADEYAGEQYGGALWAIYNSYYYGESPRLKKAVHKAEVFQELGVRPGVFMPSSLFDDDGNFLLKTWQSRLRPLKGLFESAPQRR